MLDSTSEEMPTYKLTELFSLIPEYDGDQILLSAFINSCNTALELCEGKQDILLTVHIKNKLRGRASQLINSRNINNWREIKILLNTHFGDSRDLNSLIHDLNRIRQGPNENPLGFIHRINAHNAKLHSCINTQNLSREQKESQCTMIDNMCLDTLLTGLDSKLGSIIRASNPQDLVEAAIRIKRECQLNYLEASKSPNKNQNYLQNKNAKSKFCNYCKKPGHSINDCRNKNNNSQTNQINRTHSNYNYNNNNNYQKNPYNSNNPNNQARYKPNYNSNHFNPSYKKPQFNQSNSNNQSNNYSRNTNALNRQQECTMGDVTPSTSKAQPNQIRTERATF